MLLGKQMLTEAARLHPNCHHPRILLSEEDFARIRNNQKDPILQIALKNITAMAESYFDAPVCTYEIPDGIRLLNVCRRIYTRQCVLGLCYHIYGEERYARRAYMELEAAAAFPDWNPSHFLDVGEMAAAFAVGYDWLYHWMNEEQRKLVREALYRHGILPGYRDYHHMPRSGYPWYKDQPGDNWKFVCDGGLSMAILSIFDELPSPIYEEMLTLAHADSMKAVVSFYSPLDGSYCEGPVYWHYATSYLAFYSESLRVACGSDYGLTDCEALRASPFSILSLASSDHFSFNFGDARANNVCQDVFFWFAHRYGDYSLSAMRAEDMLCRPESAAYKVLYYYRPDEMTRAKAAPLPTVYGAVGSDNASFRTGWGEDDIFAAIHFGDNSAHHGHLDMGSFILNVGSKRFFCELGPDNYNLKPYRHAYRTRAEGHNVLTLNPSPEDDQSRAGKAKVERMSREGNFRFAMADMSSAYPGKTVHRGLGLFMEEKTVLLQDEITADPSDSLLWFAHTGAEVVLAEDGRSATLTMGDAHLRVTLLGDGVLTLRPATPTEHSPVLAPAPTAGSSTPVPQDANEGIGKLTIALTGKEHYTIGVAFTVLSDAPVSIPALRPLCSWN